MKYIVGVDEVGRGPLAGPVTVGVVLCEEKLYSKLKKDKNLPKSGKDSKKLTAQKRLEYSKYLKSIKIKYSVIHISNKVIDKKGVSYAIKNAIAKAFNELKINNYYQILLDGGLKVPEQFKSQRTIIKGDEKEKIIAWASILAKVSRDEFMSKVSKKYPQYNLDIHKGYGTLNHRNNISKYGLSPIHRKTFCRNINLS